MMKKFLSIVLALAVFVSIVALAGCSEEKTQTKLKFGLGIQTSFGDIVNADAEKNGSGEVSHTVAAVLLDSNGKIVNCEIDTIAPVAEFTAQGKAVTATEFKTKYELGDNYGMKAYGGSAKEWYEQADAFEGAVKGKTIKEVSSLVAEDGKGKDNIIDAGCTIAVSDFVLALEKAAENAADSDASSEDNLNLGIVSTQADIADSTDESDGLNEIDTTVVAAVIGKHSKVVAMVTDAVTASFTFDSKGTSTLDTAAAVSTKREKGDNYNMKAYGTDLNGDGEVKEWYEQADEFDAACVGKNAQEITALVLDTGYGVDALQTAGCTINVSDMIKAALKAVK